MKLGFAHQERTLGTIKVSQSQPQEFAPPEPSSIEQYQPKQRILATKGRAIAGHEVPSFSQKLGYFTLPKDIGFDVWWGMGNCEGSGTKHPDSARLRYRQRLRTMRIQVRRTPPASCARVEIHR